MMMLMTVKTVMTIIQTPFSFNFRPGENSSFIIWKNEKIKRSAVPQIQNKTINSMEVYCNHKSGLLFKFWFEMN